MEAVPRLPMINFEHKISPENVDFASKLKQLIASVGEDPSTFEKEIKELETLRASSCIRVSETVEGVSTLKRYYCQLLFLKSRFKIGSDGPFQFSWRDIYSGADYSVGDMSHELAAILYNIGALHSRLGVGEDRQDSDGMKMAVAHFQCSAWAFHTLPDQFPQDSDSDLASEVLAFKSQLCLAQAQECILEKSLLDCRKPGIVTKVCGQVVEYYKQALKQLEMSGAREMSDHMDNLLDIVGNRQSRNWRSFMEFKVLYYSSLSMLHSGMLAEEGGKWGERVAFYQGASTTLAQAGKVAKEYKLEHVYKGVADALVYCSDVVNGKLEISKKENEFIYHEKVPELDSLPTIKGASLVKGIPFDPSDPDVSGPDLFSRIVPMEAHEASSLYSEELAKMLRAVCGEIEVANDSMVLYLSSMQLEDIPNTSATLALPQELVECAAGLSVRPQAVAQLQEAMAKLASVSADVEASLTEIQQMLKEEEVKEVEFQAIVGSRPRSIMSEMERETQKYHQAHSMASESNLTLHKAMQLHVANLKLLARPIEELNSNVPTLLELDQQTHDSLEDMRKIIAKVDEMRSQRAQLEGQLRAAVQKDDITESLARKGSVDQGKLFEEELKKHDKTVQLIKQNIQAQGNIVRAMTERNAVYADARMKVEEVMRKREEVIGSLVASYHAYEDLLNKTTKGLEFYDKLDVNVSKLVARVGGVVKVQEEERAQQMTSSAQKAADARALSLSLISGGYKPDFTPGAPPPDTPVPTVVPPTTSGGRPKLSDYLAARKSKTPSNPQPASDIPPPGIRPQPLGSESDPPHSSLPLPLSTDTVGAHVTTQPSHQPLPNQPNSNLPHTYPNMPGFQLPGYPTQLPFQYGQHPRHPLPGSIVSVYPGHPASHQADLNQQQTGQKIPSEKEPVLKSTQGPLQKDSGENQQDSGEGSKPYSQGVSQSSQPQHGQLVQNQQLFGAQQWHMQGSLVPGSYGSPNIPQAYQSQHMTSQAHQLYGFGHPTLHGHGYGTVNTQGIYAAGISGQGPQQKTGSGTSSQQVPGQGANSQQLPGQGIMNRQQMPSQVTKSQQGTMNQLSSAETKSQQMPGRGAVNQQMGGQGILSQNLPDHQVRSQQIPGQGSMMQQIPSQGTVMQQSAGQGTMMQQIPGQGTVMQQIAGQGTMSQQYQGYAIGHQMLDQRMMTGPLPVQGTLSQQIHNHEIVGQQNPGQAIIRQQIPSSGSAGASSHEIPGKDIAGQHAHNSQGAKASSHLIPTQVESQRFGVMNQQHPLQEMGGQRQGLMEQLPKQVVHLGQGTQVHVMQGQQGIMAPQTGYNYITSSVPPGPTNQIIHQSQAETGRGLANVSGQSLNGVNQVNTSFAQGLSSSVETRIHATTGVMNPTMALSQTGAVQHPHAAAMQPVSSVVQPPSAVVQQPASVVRPPPAVLQPPPAIVKQPPVVVQPPPAVVQPPPAVVQPPPAVVQPPPAVVQPLPAVLQPPPADIKAVNHQHPAVKRQQPEVLQPQHPTSMLQSTGPSPTTQSSNLALLSSLSLPITSTDTTTSTCPPSTTLQSYSVPAVPMPGTETVHIQQPQATQSVRHSQYEQPTVTEEVRITRLSQEVERMQSVVSNLSGKTLGGQSPLEIKWKEVMAIVESNKVKHSVSVARCYPAKNKVPDVLPYDQNRVILKDTKDDYINASKINSPGDNNSSYIVTQAPATKSIGEFWNMVWQEGVETMVCLVGDQELGQAVYIPRDKDSILVDGYQISVKSTKSFNNYLERVINITNSSSKQTRAVMAVQMVGWPGPDLPLSPACLLDTAVAILGLKRQQRITSRPVLVHCLEGGSKSATFLTVLWLVEEMESVIGVQVPSTQGWPDICGKMGHLMLHRKGVVRDKQYLKLVYECLLYYMQDILMKQGILNTGTATVGKKTHSRHPSQDFVGLSVNTLKEELNKIEKEDVDDNPEKSFVENKNQNPGSTILTLEQATAGPGPLKNIPDDLLKLADITESEPKKNKKISKEDFLNPSSQVGKVDESDPLSKLDPLWSLK